jgi:thiamine transport system substrate-binding protein
MYPVLDIGDALPANFGTPPQKVLTVDEATIEGSLKAWVDEALAALQ